MLPLRFVAAGGSQEGQKTMDSAHRTGDHGGTVPPPASSPEREQIIATLRQLIEPFSHALPDYTEVVLHDLALIPQSIVALHGNVTGRRQGDPATDLLLERAASGRLETMVGYHTALPDGRSLRSTTVVVRDSAGTPVAALCLNSDVTLWRQVETIARTITGTLTTADSPSSQGGPQSESANPLHTDESFVRDVDELAGVIVRQAVAEQGVPVELMRKEHKLAVVRSAGRRGIFLLRDAVEMVAKTLQVTRFTIYNYLNEIGEEDPGTAASARHHPPNEG